VHTREATPGEDAASSSSQRTMTQPMRPYLHPANVGFTMPPESATDILISAAALIRAAVTTLACQNDGAFISVATQIHGSERDDALFEPPDAQPLASATIEILESSMVALSRLAAVASRSRLSAGPVAIASVSDADLSLPIALLGGYGGRASWRAPQSDAAESWRDARRHLELVQAEARTLKSLLEELAMPTLSGLCGLLETLADLPQEASTAH
jgi:hypothetical protein